jgi:hypothetical protein
MTERYVMFFIMLIVSIVQNGLLWFIGVWALGFGVQKGFGYGQRFGSRSDLKSRPLVNANHFTVVIRDNDGNRGFHLIPQHLRHRRPNPAASQADAGSQPDHFRFRLTHRIHFIFHLCNAMIEVTVFD